MKKKKLTAKLLSLFVMAAMLISMLAVNVGAAELDPKPGTGIDAEKTSGSVILKENIADKTNTSEYSFYKVLDAKSVEGSDVYDYTWTEEFKEFTDYTLAEIGAMANGSMDYKISADTVDKAADALEKFVNDKNITTTYKAKANQSIELPLGYYLVLETTSTQNYMLTKPMLIAVPGKDESGKYNYEISITIKDQKLPDTVKKIEDEGQLKDSAEQQIDQPYNYVVWHPIPVSNPTWKKVVMTLTDKMDKGLTFVDLVSVETYEDDQKTLIKSLEKDTEFKLDVSEYNEKNGTILTFDFSDHSKDAVPGLDYYKNVKDAAWLKLTYTAKINKNAEFGPSGMMNKVIPSFSPDGETTIIGNSDKTKTYAGGLQIQKIVEDGDLPTGTEFTVYTDEDCKQEAKMATYTVTTDVNGDVTVTVNEELSAKGTADANGIIRFGGLAAGTYYIKETNAPTGYIPLDKPIEVVVTVKGLNDIVYGDEKVTFDYEISGLGVKDVTPEESDEGIAYIEVVNTKGFTLPITGGNGIYLFIACGVIFFIAAAVMILKPKKKLDK